MKKISTMVFALLVAVTMSANKFAKVTSEPKDWSGQYLLAYTNGDTAYVFNGQDVVNGYVNAVVANDTITSDDLDVYVAELASMVGGYSVQWVASGKYMSGTNNSNSLVLGADPVLNTITFNKVDSIDLISNTSVLTFNTTKNQMRFRYYKPKTVSDNKKIYCHLSLYKAETEIKPEKWTPDTLSVTEARQLITETSPLMAKSHYIYGVVTNSNYGNTWPGYAMIWMNDLENPQDSLEGFKIYKDANSTKWASAAEIPCGLGDTIMLFADGLGKFNTIYETTSGYFVEILGKATLVDANTIFPYGVGAVQLDGAAGGKYKFDVALAKSEDDYANAVHFIINSKNEKGIAGSYSIFGNGADSSYVDGEGPVAGRLTITYVEAAGQKNKYNVTATYQKAGVTYTINKDYELCGWPADFSESFPLTDDQPFIPNEGDTITCAQAASYAATLGSTTGVNVYVRGFATGFAKVDGRSQQSPYMADDSTATKGIFQAYLGYTQNRDSIIKGDEIMVYGAVSYFASKSQAQINKGQIYRIGGSKTQRPVEIEDVPADAITVADALVLGASLAAGDTSDVVTVKGYVTKLYKTFNSLYSSQSFYMDDAPFQESAFYIFEAFQSQIAVAAVVGDFVFVKGRIAKYVAESTSAARREAGDVTFNMVNSVTKFAELSSGFEEVKAVAAKAGVNKVIMNGQLYILKEGVMYNALGEKMN